MRKLLLFIGCIYGTWLTGHAQQDIQYSMYRFNGLYINPAYTGSHDDLNATAMYRTQWLNIPGAPQTASVAIHSPLKNDHVALGLIYNYDQIGVTKTNDLTASFAYRVRIGKRKNIKMCFGLAAGFENYVANLNNVATTDPNDPRFENNAQHRWLPDAKFGVYFYSPRFYTGISLSHIFTNSLTGKEYAFVTSSDSARQYYNLNISAGYVIDISKKVKFVPSMLVKYVPGHAPISFDFNANFVFIDRIWAGVAYRLNDSYNFMLAANVTKMLRIGYSYDLTVSSLRSSTSGSHEVMIGVDFAVIKGKAGNPIKPQYF